MARIPVNSCGHIDWPCCGCDNEVLTGEDALERMREEDEGYDLLPGEDMDGDFDSAMASAGLGTDEDYGYYGPDTHDIEFEDRMCGEDW